MVDGGVTNSADALDTLVASFKIKQGFNILFNSPSPWDFFKPKYNEYYKNRKNKKYCPTAFMNKSALFVIHTTWKQQACVLQKVSK